MWYQNYKKQINFLEKSLENHDSKKQLALEYSIITDEKGKIIRSVKQVKQGDVINV